MGRIADTSRPESGPPHVDQRIAELARRQHGTVALWQLLAFGLSDRAVRHRVARGVLHRVHRGVYAVGHARLSREGRWMAAVLACGPRAVLSHRSAAHAWALLHGEGVRVHVTTPDRGRTGPPGITVHRVRSLATADVTVLDGIPITTVARTILDLAGTEPEDRVARAIHEAEVQRVFDGRALQATLARANGRKGIAVVRAALADPAAGRTRTEIERRFLTLCRDAGLPQPRINANVAVPGAVVPYEVDALWPGQRLIAELDGEAVHRTRRRFRSDRARDAALAAEGYQVIRFTWDRITAQPRAVAAQLSAILAARGRPTTGVQRPRSSRALGDQHG